MRPRVYSWNAAAMAVIARATNIVDVENADGAAAGCP